MYKIELFIFSENVYFSYLMFVFEKFSSTHDIEVIRFITNYSYKRLNIVAVIHTSFKLQCFNLSHIELDTKILQIKRIPNEINL